MAELHIVQFAQQIEYLNASEKEELLRCAPELLALARQKADLEIKIQPSSVQQQPGEGKLSHDPFAKYADSQRSFQAFVSEMLEKLGGDPEMSTEEIQAEIGKAMKEENELSRTVIAMREE